MKGPELIYAYQPLVALLSRSAGIRRMPHREKISGPCFSLVGLEKLCRMVHLGITQSWYQQSMNQIHYCCFSAYGIFRYVKPSTTYEFVELQNTSCWALVEGFHIFFYIANTILMGCQKEYAWKYTFEIYEESLSNIFRISFSDFSKFVFLRCWFFERFTLCTKLGFCTTERSPRSLLILAFSQPRMERDHLAFEILLDISLLPLFPEYSAVVQIKLGPQFLCA